MVDKEASIGVRAIVETVRDVTKDIDDNEFRLAVTLMMAIQCVYCVGIELENQGQCTSVNSLNRALQLLLSGFAVVEPGTVRSSDVVPSKEKMN